MVRAASNESCGDGVFSRAGGKRVSNTGATCLKDWDNSGKPGLIPGDVVSRKRADQRVASASALRWARVLSACWGGNGSPKLAWGAGLRGRAATPGRGDGANT